jgi:hypothetical protein
MSETQGGQLITETVEVTTVHSNLSQEIIKITVDKLSLILRDYLSNIERRKEWISPFGILITLVVVFATTDFKLAYFKPETWQAFFLMATLLTIGWLILAIIRAFNSRSVEDIIEKIKSGGS